MDEKLQKWSKNTFTFSSNDIDKFILLLRNGCYAYKYMGEWDKFNEITLPENNNFYSNLKMEDIIFRSQLWEKSLERFLNKKIGRILWALICLEMYELDPVKFHLAPGLARQATSEKTEIEFELITDIDVLLMAEKVVRAGLCLFFNIYAKAYRNMYEKLW